MSPAFANPTSITVVAELLWMMLVTVNPTRTPLMGLFVRAYRMRLRESPAAF
jgi:hypothetical protein